MALISITRLRVRSVWYLPGFIYYALKSSRQAKRAAGNLDIGLLREANMTFWTRNRMDGRSGDALVHDVFTPSPGHGKGGTVV